ncbi:MAG: choice-of-anchor B family protein [bacterium]|nr:choice-of-anchor B family protein [bacterium]
MGLQHGSWNAVRLGTGLGLALAISAGSIATAHDDDVRKLLDRQAAVKGPIYSYNGQRSGPYAAHNITLLAQIPLNNFPGVNPGSGNDCWGYVSQSGREYAIMGLEGGYGFVDITNPTSPVIVDTVSGPSSLWHDVKVLGDYAYGVSEGGSGIQVMDLSDIDNGNVRLVRNWQGGGYSTTHNIVTNEDSGSLWVVGANIGNGGLVHIDISNPELPQLDGGWTDMYVHDAQVVTWNSGALAGREIAFCAGGFSGGFSETGLRIVDVTNPNNTQTLATVFYPSSGYAHQVWVTPDQKYLYLNDELDEGSSVSVTTTRVINIEDPQNPSFVGTYTTGLPAIDHNLYINDDFVFQANYQSGLRVFDNLDPENPVEVAWIDTHPGGNDASFNGAWSSYPFFPSGNIIISDIERGLFIVRVDAQPLQIAVSSEGDLPSVVNPAGGEVLTAKTVTRDGVGVASVSLMLDTGSGYQPIAMSDNGDGTYSAAMPVVPCGDDISYYFQAESSNGATATFPSDATSNPMTAAVVSDIDTVFADNAETNTGWSVSGDAGDGQWNRGVPVGGGDRADPPTDADGSGRAWLTDNEDDNSDVDNGTTTLTSPALDASAGNMTLGFALWYNNAGNSAVDDNMTVQASNNNGGSWTTILDLGPGDPNTGGGWVNYEYSIDSIFSNPSSQFRIRFNVSDVGDGSIVEAGVDDIRLEQRSCEDVDAGCNGADLAEPFGTLNFFDVSAFLSAFNNADPAADFNSDGSFDFFDVSAFLSTYNAGCP